METDLVKCVKDHKPLDVEEKIYDISIQRPEIFDQLKDDISLLCRGN